MFRTVRGNILDADVQALVNTVNTVGVMGRGIALQFKRAFPENYEAYRQACERGEVETGRLFVYDLNRLHNPRYVINFPTKRHCKGKSTLAYIESGLDALVREVDRLGIESIALPPLGCGLGGLKWSDVFPRIRQALGNLSNVEVLIYEPAGPPEAQEMKTATPAPRMTAGRAALLGLIKRYLSPLMDDAVSLLEIHKLMYFMQEAGEPLRLQFTKGKYGPYATNLHHVLERMEGHFIVGYGEGTEAPGKTIDYKPEAVEAAEKFLVRHPQTHERFSRIERLIEGFETPYGMELLSSVHWLACHESGDGQRDPKSAVQGMREWNDRKRQTFKAGHIEAAWSRLREQRWL